MCGFVGVFANVTNIENSSLIEIGKMSKHRGPNDSDLWFDDKYKVLFNRLAIVELTDAGRQPMSIPNGNWVVVFNGELYNHFELREKLPKYNYKGKSDTETLVFAIENWGFEKAIKEINGMFAIAAYNKVEKTLWLARDFAGIKPLFYSTGTESVWFASQFNQVIQGIGKKKVTLSRSGMRDFLQLGYMQAPETVYEEIKQIFPGEIVVFDLQRKKKHKKYYELPKQSNIEKSLNGSSHQKFSDLMTKVVGSQLVSDVPIGSFLSSGIDSTLVCGFASKTNKNIKTFTIGTEGYVEDERTKAKEYSKILNLEHESQSIVEHEILDVIDESISLMGEPFGDYSSIPTFLITKYAKKYNTVMLSGDGGDELFWGYPRWNKYLLDYKYFKLPVPLRRLQTYLIRLQGGEIIYSPTIFRTPGDRVLNSHSHNDIPLMNKIMPGSKNSSTVEDLYDFSSKPTKLEFRDWLRWNEFYAHLQRVLIKVDRMSMANSLEVRVPFLDKRIIEFAWNNKSSYGQIHYINKKFLKDQLNQFIPENRINKKKLGFSVPIEDWLKGNLKAVVQEKLLECDFYGEEFVDKFALETYIKDFYSGNHHNSWGIWILYCWQKWGDYMNSSQ